MFRNFNGYEYTFESIKEGFERFFRENGHYPSALEVDQCEYLPSSRQIQRRFGGLVNIREKFGLDDEYDYSQGKARKKIAKEADKRAVLYEEEFYNFLISKIPEIRVHEHKILRPGNVCCDFFIYTTEGDGVALDLFYAKDTHCLQGIINIKHKVYLPVKFLVYFIVVGNNSFEQKVIDVLVNRKKNILPSNRKIFTEDYFKNNFEKLVSIFKRSKRLK